MDACVFTPLIFRHIFLLQAFMTTHTAASSGMVTWLFCDYFRNKKLSASGACIGAVVG